jgi:mannosyltransferase
MTDLARRMEGSRWAVLIPMAIAAVLGIVTIGSKSFWLDEAFSASIIRLPTPDLVVFLFHNEQQASPYYLVLQAWSAVGYSETALRLLSVVIGVIAVAATYALGRRFGVGLWAALLLAVAPFFIHYEQEVRVYTLLVAWSAIATLAYLRLVELPNRWRGAAYVIAAAGLIYIHPLSAWLLVAHALATLLFAPREWRLRLLALYVPVAIAAIPMIRFLAINRSKAYWIPPVTPYGFVHSLSQLMGAASLAVALTLVVLAGLAVAWRRELRPPGVALPGLSLPGLWLPLLVGGFTVGGILLMSFTVQPLFVERYLIGVLPVVFIVVARMIKALPWPRVILAGLLAISMASTASWYLTGVKDDWRGAVAYVQSQARPTDGVIFWPNFYRMPFVYYGTAGEPIFPAVPWSTLYLPNLGISNYIPPDVPNDRIWLVRDTGFNPSPELSLLLGQYETVTTSKFGNEVPQIDLLVRR